MAGSVQIPGLNGNVYSGINGAFSVSGDTWPADEFSFEIDCDLHKIRNFLSNGCNQNLDGFRICNITAKGPYSAPGDMVLVVGQVYTFTGTIGGAVAFSVSARVGKIRLGQGADKYGTIDITAESHGTFSAQSI